jgi:hypothetical protein
VSLSIEHGFDNAANDPAVLASAGLITEVCVLFQCRAKVLQLPKPVRQHVQ